MNPYLFIAFFLMFSNIIPVYGQFLAGITLVIGLVHFIVKKIEDRQSPRIKNIDVDDNTVE